MDTARNAARAVAPATTSATGAARMSDDPRDPVVELVRPDGEAWCGDIYVPKRELADGKRGERFERGERIIMVDGVRWGRTHVTRHGVWGTKYTIEQRRGSIIQEPTGFTGKGSHKERDVEIRSIRKRYNSKPGEWRPTEELVLEKVRELIDSGKLIHPEAQREINERASREYREAVDRRDRKEAEEFRAKAREALGINDPASDSPLIDKVVEAMRWAQTK